VATRFPGPAVPEEEATTITAAQAGDREAFGTLFRRYSRAIHGLLVARVGPGSADDLLQEVFLSAMQKIGSLRDPAAIGGWLSMIARNLSIDLQEPGALPAHEQGRSDPDRLEALEVLDAIRSLPEVYRETLILRLVEGLTGPEIAQQTGLTPGSVRVNLHRGIKLLKAKLTS
jgi:RNA polymerase sigma-70 factor, ECF subfamily